MATRVGPALSIDADKLVLGMAGLRSMPEVVDLIARPIAASASVCLVCVWLVRDGGPCATCPMRSECPDQTKCLHLVASAGGSTSDPSADYSRLDEQWRRLPIGVGEIGQIAQTGEAMEAPHMAEAPAGGANANRLLPEGIRGFSGQPLVHQGKVLGVLGVFSRTHLESKSYESLRKIADHAAAAIANACAWHDFEAFQQRLLLENKYLQEEVREAAAIGQMIGQSTALQTVARQIELVAPTDSPVLILGEPGTGKDLVAREIHRRSQRAQQALIKVQCTNAPHTQLESELFGHERGAVVETLQDHLRQFELADGLTLLLDNVDRLPLESQDTLVPFQAARFRALGRD